MAKIYRKSDRIKIKIGGDDGLVLTVSPLDHHQKTEVQQLLTKSQLKSSPEIATQGIMLAMKYAIKDVEGVLDTSGNIYKLTLQDGMLTDECVDELLNMELAGTVMIICSTITNGIPKKFINPTDGKDLPEVEIVRNDSEKKTQPV